MTTTDAILFLLENNLNFRAEVGLNDARAILSKFKKYNSIPSYLPSMVDRIKDLIGPVNFGKDNPNNGFWHNIKFSIGNESSLVIYVEVRGVYRPKDDPNAIRGVLESMGSYFCADEVDCELQTIEFGSSKKTNVIARFLWD